MKQQEIFETCYRGRQTFLHHVAYLRMGKVLLLQQLLSRTGISLERKTVFDYGFGAGAFLRSCPKSSHIFGVEIDPENVASVRATLSKQGHKQVELEPIDPVCWSEHSLLKRTYDVIVCSHVLEHLPNPVAFLNRIKPCLNEGGAFLGLVPLNERRQNPEHLHVIREQSVRDWAEASGLSVKYYCEADPWFYWCQPLFTYHSGWQHKLAQCSSLALGLPATICGPEVWDALSRPFAWVTNSKPAQAGFVFCNAR